MHFIPKETTGVRKNLSGKMPIKARMSNKQFQILENVVSNAGSAGKYYLDIFRFLSYSSYPSQYTITSGLNSDKAMGFSVVGDYIDRVRSDHKLDKN
jgi:hypothetical protein